MDSNQATFGHHSSTFPKTKSTKHISENGINQESDQNPFVCSTEGPQFNLDFGADTAKLHIWLKKSDGLSWTISPLYRPGSKPMHLLMTIRFRELGQRDSPIARTIPLSIPAKTN